MQETLSRTHETPTNETQNPWLELTQLANNQETSPSTTENRETTKSFAIERLSPDDNMEQVADALYLTDQYILPDLFGNPEKAKTFIGALFSEDPDSLFSYDKTFVAKDEDGNVAGILAYREDKCTPWDTDKTREKFLATGLELPENFERVNENYLKKVTATELPAGAIELEFLGVRDAYRRNGLATRLIDATVGASDCKEVHLDVLDSHPWARSFYENYGFEPIGEKFGNYPDKTEGVQHMVKQIK